jgi:hypothetical protein
VSRSGVAPAIGLAELGRGSTVARPGAMTIYEVALLPARLRQPFASRINHHGGPILQHQIRVRHLRNILPSLHI